MTVWSTFPLVQCHEQFCVLARLAAPSLEALEAVSDKHSTISLARELKVPVPETLLVRSMDGLEAARGWPYPIVVKDRFSVRWLADKAVFGSTSYADSWDELYRKVQKRLEQAGGVVGPQVWSGGRGGVSCFFLGGEADLALQLHRGRGREAVGRRGP